MIHRLILFHDNDCGLKFYNNFKWHSYFSKLKYTAEHTIGKGSKVLVRYKTLKIMAQHKKRVFYTDNSEIWLNIDKKSWGT